MQGLDLSRHFFFDIASPLFQETLPDFYAKAAFGLVGEGSECFGFDDEHSQDHDWGAGFCMWLPREAWSVYLDDVEALIMQFPKSFENYSVRMHVEQRMGRVGPMSIEKFYARFIGHTTPPSTWQMWRAIPEHYLATCTNGDIFLDNAGEFTAFREALLAFYPEDIRLKKLAARCFTMAQTGQYNLPRTIKRHEYSTAMLMTARFCEAAISTTYLLNKRYMPFYKWAHKGLLTLPLLGQETYDAINQLAAIAWPIMSKEAGLLKAEATPKNSHARSSEHVNESPCHLVVETLVERHCQRIAEILRAKNLSHTQDDWLMEHANQIQSRIQTPELLQMPVMLE